MHPFILVVSEILEHLVTEILGRLALGSGCSYGGNHVIKMRKKTSCLPEVYSMAIAEIQGALINPQRRDEQGNPLQAP